MPSRRNLFPEIDTPALLIERRVMEANITRMQALADRHGVALRPHVKTHKSSVLARRQLDAGAVGIAVAKLGEAEVMANAGVGDIQIANQIVGPEKISRLVALARRAKVSCAIDSADNAAEISQACEAAEVTVDLLVEVDTGLGRCGVKSAAEVIDLAKRIVSLRSVRLAGIMTHAGHVYGATNSSEVVRIGRHEGHAMVVIAQQAQQSGINFPTISVGSTPTAPYAAAIPGVTELRVGNYIFNDMIQVALGVADEAGCALSVLATVISARHGHGVIDAGSKALTTETGAHGNRLVSGFGQVSNAAAQLVRLSEEHGILASDEPLSVGDRVRIVPNHACAVVNLFDWACLVEGNAVLERISLDARGRSQ